VMDVLFYGTVEVHLACARWMKSQWMSSTHVHFQLTHGKQTRLSIEVSFIENQIYIW